MPEVLREQEFGVLLDAAPDAMVVIDSEGSIRLANVQTERLFGYARDELIGRPVESLLPARYRSLHIRHRATYLVEPTARPMGADLELFGERKDGTEFPVDISLSPIDTPRGRLVVAAIRDVTERRRAEAKFRGLLEAAPDAIVGVDAQGRIVLVNGQAERLFGYHRDELLGRSVEILVPEGARGDHVAHRAQYFDKPTTRPMGAGLPLMGRRRDGSRFPAEISLSALDTEEGLTVSAAIRDVTDYRAALERARAADGAKDEFVRTVSHELRTPLTSLLGSVDLLADSGLDEVQRGALARLRTAAERLAGIVTDVLDLSKLEAGRAALSNVAFSLGEVVDETVTIGRGQVGERELRVLAAIDPTLPTMVLGDREKLAQVLLNLVGNAVKFTERGEVRLSAEATDGDVVRFTVADTGIGMSSDIVERLFEPFYQAESGTTRRYGGTGLGLTICQRNVALMGGTIEARSRPGHGSVFTVTVPLSATEDAQPTVRAMPEAWTGASRGRVLLAEDEPDSRTVLAAMVARLGYEVDTVADGEEAVEAFRGASYDVVLMDARMPRLNGFEAAAAIRSLEQAERRPLTPILALTAMAGPRDAAASRAAGMDAHVTKPVRLEELEATLRRFVVAPAELDRATIDELRESLGGQLSRTVELFVETNAARLAELRDAPSAEERAGVLHRIKGASGQIGAVALHELAARLEEGVSSGSAEVGQEELDELQATAERAVELLRRAVGDDG